MLCVCSFLRSVYVLVRTLSGLILLYVTRSTALKPYAGNSGHNLLCKEQPGLSSLNYNYSNVYHQLNPSLNVSCCYPCIKMVYPRYLDMFVVLQVKTTFLIRFTTLVFLLRPMLKRLTYSTVISILYLPGVPSVVLTLTYCRIFIPNLVTYQFLKK